MAGLRTIVAHLMPYPNYADTFHFKTAISERLSVKLRPNTNLEIGWINWLI